MAMFSTEMAREQGPRPGKKYFTLAEARRALPLIKRIAKDVRAVQGLRVTLNEQIHAHIAQTQREEALLEARFDLATSQLEGYIQELAQVGAELKDASTALLDFPALHQGREVLLCWQGGEETITHWHERDGGFAGRKPVEMLEG
jgi:hypothetical protein